MLLDEIIAILSDEKGTLNSALLKTKVLMHSLGKKDLTTWVTNELKGYPDENVPEYRMIGASVHGHVINMTMQIRDYTLPILHLSKERQQSLTHFACQLSIDSVEESVKRHREKGQKLARPLPTEFGGLFKEVLTSDTNVVSAWCEVNMIEVENILAEVRSRLLDFVLELRDVVGIDVPEKDLAAKAAVADTEKMFATSIYGNSNTIIIASQGIQTITNRKDDIEGLIAAVGKLGFTQRDLEDFKQAVLEDRSEGKTPDVSEGKTGKWFIKALKETGKGVMKTGVDVVSSVIVKALKAYTGTP